MLENFRKTQLIWDKASTKIKDYLRGNSSDNNGRKLTVTVTDDGRTVDLTGVSLMLYWETQDKKVNGLDSFNAVHAQTGQFEIYYTPELLSNVGNLNAQLVLVDNTGRVASEIFEIRIFKGIDDGAVVGQASFTALTDALHKVNNLETTYAPRLNSVEINKAEKTEVNNLAAQLAETMSQTEFDSWVATLLDGGPSIFMDSLAMLQSTYPNGAAGVALVRETDPSKIYVWNGAAWEDFGDYQGIEIADESVTTKKLTSGAVTGSKAAFFKTTRNLFDLEKIERYKAYNATAKAFTTNAGTYVFKFPVVAGQAITIKDGLGSGYMGHSFMNASGVAITTHISNVTGPATYTAPTGAVEMIMTGVTERINSQQIELGEETEYIPHRIMDNRFIENPVTNRDNVYAYLVALGGAIDVNTVTKSISLPSGAKYIFYGGKFISLQTTTQSVPYQNGFLYFDTVSKVFSSGVDGDIKNKPHVLILGYISNNYVFLNTKYTVNGKADLSVGSVSSDMLRSNLYGKKGVSAGDSITWYDGKPFGASHSESGQIAVGYQTYMRQQLGCEVDNIGASGQDMLAIANIIKSYAGYVNTDFITITSGANDERKGVPVGTIQGIGSDFDLTTYTGSLQSAIEYVINANKKIKIFLMTPIRGWYNEFGTVNVPNTDPSVVGMMSEKYANAIKAVGKLYGLPVLDWYNDTRLNELNKNTFLGDGLSLPYFLHPTNEFYERMASPLIPFLNNN